MTAEFNSNPYEVSYKANFDINIFGIFLVCLISICCNIVVHYVICSAFFSNNGKYFNFNKNILSLWS